MIENILSIQEALEEANLPDDEDDIESHTDTDLYKLLERFYQERGDVNPERYIIETDDDRHEVKTTLGKHIGDNLSIEQINALNLHHSHFSTRGLEEAGIDKKNSWNGEKAGLMYENGTVNILKSDYYTVKTFSSLPYVELKNVLSDYEDPQDVPLEELNLRNSYMKNKEDFHKTKWMCSGGSVGGVIIANTGDTWKIILGERSDKTSINSGRLSIAPNGALQYDHMCDEGFQKDLKLHFNEELFRGTKQPRFFEDYVEPYMVSIGWNLRNGELSVGYALLVRDPEGYEKLIGRNNHNFEFTELLEIDVNDPEELVEKVNIENASPSTIPTIYRSVALYDNVIEDSEIDYKIERSI